MEWERHFEHCSGDRSDKHLEIWNISLVPSCLSKIASLGNLPSQRTEPLRHTPSLQSSLWFFSCMCLFGKSQIAESSFFQWSWCQRNPFQKNPPVYGNPIFVKSADIILGFSKIIFSRDLKGESLPDPRGMRCAHFARGQVLLRGIAFPEGVLWDKDGGMLYWKHYHSICFFSSSICI